MRPSIEEIKSRREAAAKENFWFDKVERMEGNIGYLEFRSFTAPVLAAETASAAMSFVANTDALIIDLRKNGGGQPGMVAFMASYLFDERTHLNVVVPADDASKAARRTALEYIIGTTTDPERQEQLRKLLAK